METRALTPRLTLLRFAVGQAPLGRLRRIVLTHFHDDHAGSAAELAAADVPVLAHRADAPVIRGDRPGPPPAFTPAERELHARVAAGLPPAPPARVDVELEEGDRLDIGGGATVLSVPGHTEGSIALHLPADGVLFTGDLIAEWDGDLALGPFTVDAQLAAASMRRLAVLSDVDIACFGHGDPVVGAATDRLRPLSA